jgi:hypothetical protein
VVASGVILNDEVERTLPFADRLLKNLGANTALVKVSKSALFNKMNVYVDSCRRPTTLLQSVSHVVA